MAEKPKIFQRFGMSVRACAVVGCALALTTVPVLAQFGGFGGGGWGGGGGRRGNFDSFFNPYSRQQPVERQTDYSHAPPPKKLEAQPTGGTILVLGDSMADWLAYGLEDAVGDPPDFAVVRRNRTTSGLLRYDSRNEQLDWAGQVREAIAQTKPKFVVMMLGLNDRMEIRERAPAPAAKGASAPATADKPADAAKSEGDEGEKLASEQPVVIAPDAKKGGPTRTYEFRSDEWEAYYIRRIDQTLAALKSAGVPVFWVGLPAIRGPKSTSDMQYLDDLYRGRAEKAGVTYIDVWDGFVDDTGRFLTQGPDFEGQTRKLRTSDGVYFTKSGARKLAHYLDREIRRMMQPGAEVVSLPSSEPQAPAGPAKANGPAQRPLAGPVVPLTVSLTQGQELIGSNDPGAVPTPKSVTRVLVNGDAVDAPAGRSDDFKWPRRAIAPFGTDPVVATTTEPIPVMKPAPETTVAAPSSEPRAVANGSGVPSAKKPATTAAASPARPQGSGGNSSYSFFSFFRR
jgi:hypothetical protein